VGGGAKGVCEVREVGCAGRPVGTCLCLACVKQTAASVSTITDGGDGEGE
jgi:hypothetical protein